METPGTRPTTYQKNLAKLPAALAPLCERPQWAVWRWTLLANGGYQKLPFTASEPQRHASVKDPSTWTDYVSALAAVQAGNADGITYILTENDPFAAIDLDHCRDVNTHSIDIWAQNFLDTGRHSYSEVTPSGTGCRIWGLTATSNTLHKKFSLLIDGREVALELFRRTNKALTITGHTLDTIRELTNIDRVIDWAIVWAERRKAADTEAAAKAATLTNGFNSNGSKYSIDEIEQIVRDGAPAGTNHSDVFHSIVGHYVGCGWSVEQITGYLKQFPDGISGRYLREDRLHKEITRSVGKYTARALPLVHTDGLINDCQVKAPQPEISDQQRPGSSPAAKVEPEPTHDPEEHLDDELDDDLDEDLDEVPQRQDPKLPQLFAHGDPDPRPLQNWLVKALIPKCGHGLLSGQWGTGKTFVVFDLAAALATGQQFVGHSIKRQCGV
jgi:hypothetical protein